MLTENQPRPILIPVAKTYRVRLAVADDDLKNLESRIDALIDACQKLKNENGEMSDEHGKLVEKTRQARSRIENMILRLKALERS